MMTRDDALTYLTTEYQELAAEAGFSSTQTDEAYSLATDMALRQLGIDEEDLPSAQVNQPQILGFLALLGYYALRRFARLLSLRTSITVAGSLSDARNQAGAAVKTLLDESAAECAGLGYPVDGQLITSGRFMLDFLEPTQGNF